MRKLCWFGQLYVRYQKVTISLHTTQPKSSCRKERETKRKKNVTRNRTTVNMFVLLGVTNSVEQVLHSEEVCLQDRLWRCDFNHRLILNSLGKQKEKKSKKHPMQKYLHYSPNLFLLVSAQCESLCCCLHCGRAPFLSVTWVPLLTQTSKGKS